MTIFSPLSLLSLLVSLLFFVDNVESHYIRHVEIRNVSVPNDEVVFIARESSINDGNSSVIDTFDYLSVDSTMNVLDARRRRRLARPLRTSNSSPLGKCQGDCDSNDDCEGRLVCYQVGSRGGSVPGCSGRSDGTDYCVDPSDGNDGDDNDNDGGDDGNDGDNNGGGGGGGGGGKKLKMYWQNGYMWQENPREMRWCMQCADCGSRIIFDNSGDRCKRSSCSAGKQLSTVYCKEGGDSFTITSDSMIRSNSGTCFTRTNGVYLTLQKCNSSDSQQKWRSMSGNKFEIGPTTNRDYCVSQMHHPKSGEPLGLMPCRYAHGDDTGNWVQY